MTNKPTLSDWNTLAAKEVKGRDLTWQTPEGIAVKPLYTFCLGYNCLTLRNFS